MEVVATCCSNTFFDGNNALRLSCQHSSCFQRVQGGYPGKGASSLYGFDGTLVFTPQDGPEADCSAAVEYWVSALKDFQGVPAQYKSDNEPLYDTAHKVHLLL